MKYHYIHLADVLSSDEVDFVIETLRSGRFFSFVCFFSFFLCTHVAYYAALHIK